MGEADHRGSLKSEITPALASDDLEHFLKDWRFQELSGLIPRQGKRYG